MANAPVSFTPSIQAILDKYGATIPPLTGIRTNPVPETALLRDSPADRLFPGARNPQASVSALLLLLNDWNAGHSIAQDIATVDGSYWHAIVHRMEPDSFNASYWFRRVGNHPIFPDLHRRAQAILADAAPPHWRLKPAWDAFRFIEWCDEARQQPGTRAEQIALAIQKAEWHLLFEWCSQAVD